VKNLLGKQHAGRHSYSHQDPLLPLFDWVMIWMNHFEEITGWQIFNSCDEDRHLW